jgi:hypothetical protein
MPAEGHCYRTAIRLGIRDGEIVKQRLLSCPQSVTEQRSTIIDHPLILLTGCYEGRFHLKRLKTLSPA